MSGERRPVNPVMPEEELEEHFEELCHGRWEGLLELDLREVKQVEAYTLSKLAQWCVNLEQRTKQ